MKRQDFEEEYLSDVKNLQSFLFIPGQTTSFDLALMYPGGFVL